LFSSLQESVMSFPAAAPMSTHRARRERQKLVDIRQIVWRVG
jgi:hypothetical protein